MLVFLWIYLLIGILFAIAGANHPPIKELREKFPEFNERIAIALVILIFVWPLAVLAAIFGEE